MTKTEHNRQIEVTRENKSLLSSLAAIQTRTNKYLGEKSHKKIDDSASKHLANHQQSFISQSSELSKRIHHENVRLYTSIISGSSHQQKERQSYGKRNKKIAELKRQISRHS